jgi:uncharacterized protein (UPF0335 family)
MDTLESIATQLHDMDTSNAEDKKAIYEQLRMLAGRIGSLEISMKQMLDEMTQLKRVAKDTAFDTVKAVNEVNKVIGGGDK